MSVTKSVEWFVEGLPWSKLIAAIIPRAFRTQPNMPVAYIYITQWKLKVVMSYKIYCHRSALDIVHDDVIKWKHFPRYWPFVRGIHRSPVNSPHKGQWRRALVFSLIWAWINGGINNREAGDLRRRLDCLLNRLFRRRSKQGKSEGFDSCDRPRFLLKSYATSSFVHRFIAIRQFRLDLQSGNG